MNRPVPFIDPSRPKPKRRPLKAWRHMQKLIEDKEDTEQVFHIIEALNGGSTRKDFQRFMASESGPKLLEQRSFLPDILDDHAPLKALPEGTVGRAYVEFMEREGLTAHGLVEESLANRKAHEQYDDDLLWYANRLRDTHDMYHVLTGYGRDALGEDALLGYTHSQHGGLGVSFIAFMGNRQIAKQAPKAARVREVLAEGRRNGKAAKRIIEQDIIALLDQPIDAVRKRLNIAKPVLYRRALEVFREYEQDPQLVAA
ncbi:MAG: ubiquinone biosynthesis protein COQ4 [Hyphomonadaceae bacterium]|nr:ubiquinone biosynthesis protein COQ4 [Hyphomonadaceae bacterium]